MKQDKRTTEPQTSGVTSPATEPAGLDFLVVLQAGAGVLCLIFAAWVVLKFILHIL